MEGFFSKKETESLSRSKGRTYSCTSCGLYKNCSSQKIKPSGNFKKGIINVMTEPDKSEDRNGAYTGKQASYLTSLYKQVGIDLHEDCLNIYAINCYPGDIEPDTFQIASCSRIVSEIISKHKPKVIALFGKTPLISVIGSRWKKDLGELKKWQGWKIPDQELNAWIVPTFDLTTIMMSKTQVERLFLLQDLKSIEICSKTELYRHITPNIHYIDDLNELNNIKEGLVAFDYETTGIKPYAQGHKIVCASVAVDSQNVYTFVMPQDRQKQLPFIRLLRNKKIGKIAQNMKFEDTWSNIFLKSNVSNWHWDTMQATHIIDNRENITGLKFQTYVQFGVIDYDSSISAFLKSDSGKGSNGINKIESLMKSPKGERELLTYCALDSIFEYRLYLKQKEIITPTQSRGSKYSAAITNAYNLFHTGILSLAKAERQGLRIDEKYVKNTTLRLTKKIENLELEFKATKFFKEWQKSSKEPVNLNSDTSLGNFLYGIKKIKAVKFTDKGKPSTDAETLKLLKIPELDLLLERSKLLKIRDTYLAAFAREIVDGFIHPFFNLHLVSTYRSSSSEPNFQNIPKRDKEAMKIVRKAIYPRVGNQLMELDFKGIEVAIAACYHKDPTMLKYITDPKSDMHGDMASQIFKIDKFNKHQQGHAYLRSAVKNGFVFPQFYGDYYKNNADNICGHWISLPQTKWESGQGYEFEENKSIGSHLIKQGIKSYEHFCNHLQKIEDHFWNVRFPKYRDWKQDWWDSYLKYGYVPFYTGFVVSGIMGKKEVINYPIQGTAFHILLWLFNEITQACEELGLESKLVGQIHDAVVLDIYPPELLQVYNIVIDLVKNKLPKVFPFVIVPMEIEAELCPVDAPWSEKSEWKPSS